MHSRDLSNSTVVLPRYRGGHRDTTVADLGDRPNRVAAGRRWPIRSPAPPAMGRRALAEPPVQENCVPTNLRRAHEGTGVSGPGRKAWEDVSDPSILDETDAVVRVDTVTICGTDLHILKGDVPAVTDGRILGHEAVGTVEAVGSAVTNVAPGDRVLVSCISACGAMPVLPRGRLRPVPGRRRLDPRSHNRRHAGRVRAGAVRRHLDLPVPPGVDDEDVLMLADILPTGYEVGVLNGTRAPGRHGRRSSAPARSDWPPCWGPGCSAPATSSRSTSPTRGSTRRRVRRRRRRQPAGQDPLAPCRSSPAGSAPTSPSRRSACRTTFELCTRLVRPGGHVANVGVHGKPATLHLEDLWIRNVTITTGLVDTYSTPTLLRLLTTGQLDADRFVTHRFALDDFLAAYDVFARAAETGALKVVLTRS